MTLSRAVHDEDSRSRRASRGLARCAAVAILLALPASAAAQGVFVAPNIPPPQVTDPAFPTTTVTFRSADIPGSDAGSNTFRFDIRLVGGSFTTVQPFSASRTFPWIVNDFDPGIYVIRVVVKATVGGASVPDESATTTFELTPAGDIPVDPDTFLVLGESHQEEGNATATAYYDAIDPSGEKDTLNKWLRAVGFQDPGQSLGEGDAGDDHVDLYADAHARYTNPTDFNFTRNQFARRDDDGDVYFYTENYQSLDDAIARSGVFATVCMEYSPNADGTGSRFIKFFAYGPDGSRVNAADLDGRGAKFIPGACVICHGGKPKALENGIYPDQGRIGSEFLPFDVQVFEFDNNSLNLNRASEEAALKVMNERVLASLKNRKLKLDEDAGIRRRDPVVELIYGWYGGETLPRATFRDDFVPKGWRASTPGVPADAPRLYKKVVLESCRFCHITRERSLDLATYAGFAEYKDAHLELVFGGEDGLDDDGGVRPGDDQLVMPLAKRTYERFWASHEQADLLADFLDTIPSH